MAYVLSGEITFKIGDDVTVGGPGACAFMPRGVPHAWKIGPPPSVADLTLDSLQAVRAHLAHG